MVWLNFPKAYGFVMFSPNLHDIWVMFFLNLSQELKLVSFAVFWDLGRWLIHCRAVKNSLRGTLTKPNKALKKCKTKEINFCDSLSGLTELE